MVGACSGRVLALGACLYCSVLPAQPPTVTVSAAVVRALPVRSITNTNALRISDDTVDFGRIAGGCLQPGGRVVVLSAAPPKLLVVERNAKPMLRTIGREGDGPGEYKQPWGISCFSNDSVAVLELARVTSVSIVSGSANTQATQPLEGESWFQLVARFSANTYLFRTQSLNRSPTLGTVRDSVDLYLSPGPRGVKQGTRILRLPGPESVRASTGGAITTALHPFARTLLVATSATAMYAMDTGAKELLAFDTRGKIVGRAQFTLPQRRLTSAMVASFRSARLSSARPGLQRTIAQDVLDQTVMPSSLPLFDRIVALTSGGVMLREFMSAADTLARWIELDRNLTPRAVLHLPSSLHVLAADERTLLGVLSGDNGTEIVHLPTISSRPPRER